MNAPLATRPARRLRPGVRRAVLTIHIAASVALLLGPQTSAMADDGSGSQTLLVAASARDVVALALATCLSVYKPGRARHRPAVRRRVPSISARTA